MKVTIWDLDYYYNPSKRNAFNPDVMKISSYHKQLGDKINFVLKPDDIYRPYDLYYIIKEKSKTPNPPSVFYLDKNVRWWGKAVKMRINWRMNDIMLGCHPDYLIYPERNTVEERAEHIRFFNNQAQPLNWIQNWTNTYKRKKILITDPYFWYASKENIITALSKIAELPQVSFLEPIWIQKLILDKDIKESFFNIKFKPGTHFTWSPINLGQWNGVKEFLLELRQKYNADIGKITIDYRNKLSNHWENRELALSDYAALRKIIVEAKENGIYIEIRMPTTRFETPYFELFESLSIWTRYYFQYSWLEFLTINYGKIADSTKWSMYWNTPKNWNDVFRSLLRQSYEYVDFLVIKWLNKKVSLNEIPWNKWKEEFKYGI